MRLSVRLGPTVISSLGFSRARPRDPDAPKGRCALPEFGPSLAARAFQGPGFRRTEQRFLPGPVADVPEFVCVAATTRVRVGGSRPHALSRTGPPVRRPARLSEGRPPTGPVVAKLIYPSGATHSRPSAVLVKPCSTSAFKVSLLNIRYYHRDLHRGPLHSRSPAELLRDPRARLLVAASGPPPRPEPGRGVRRDGRV